MIDKFLELKCVVSGELVFLVYWFKNGKELNFSDIIKVIYGKGRVDLIEFSLLVSNVLY